MNFAEEDILGKWPFTRLRRRWKDNVKMDLRDVGCEDGMWMDLA
jgi:hypothetical protein